MNMMHPMPRIADLIPDEPLVLARRDLDALNARAKATMAEVRMLHRDFTDRVLVRHLSSSELAVFTAITTRTLAFAKFAETIPMSQFANGLRDPANNGELLCDKRGLPYFEGTGLDANTIRKAISGLRKKGLIAVLAVPRNGTKPVHAYAAMSLRSFFIVMVDQHVEHTLDLHEVLRDTNYIFSMNREPAHELEQRFAALFREGLELCEESNADLRSRLMST